MNATHDSLVKFDRRGRLRYAPEQKAALMEAFAASGLSGPKFAALHGVKYQTFAAWLQKQKHTTATRGLPAPQDWALVEVALPASRVAACGLTVLLPPEFCLPVHDSSSTFNRSEDTHGRRRWRIGRGRGNGDRFRRARRRCGGRCHYRKAPRGDARR